jgi:hypothetical protein
MGRGGKGREGDKGGWDHPHPGIVCVAFRCRYMKSPSFDLWHQYHLKISAKITTARMDGHTPSR